MFAELLWFLRGDTNVKWLQDRGVTIWDEWADDDGDLGPVYGYQWRSWPTPDGRHVDQIAQVVEQIRRDPDSPPPHRRRPGTSPTSRRWRSRRATRCSSSTSPDGPAARCQLYQRSADVFLGVPFNIASYALLTHMVAQVTGLEVGDFVHTLGDAHLYSNHLDQARLQLTRDPRPLPDALARPGGHRARRVRPRAHRGRGLRPAPRHQGAHRRMTVKRVVLVAAVADNGVIGDGGGHPVAAARGPQRTSSEPTIGHTLVMGRTTYESIGRPLPGRTRSCSPATRTGRPRACSSRAALDEALALAEALDGDVMVVGGAPGLRRGAAAAPTSRSSPRSTSSPRATRSTRCSTAPSGPRPAASATTATTRLVRLIERRRGRLARPWSSGSSPSPSRARPTTTCSPSPRTAEELGFGAFFRSDHYLGMGTDGLPGPTDAWVTLAGLARDTSTIRLGTLMTSATFRLPGPLAIAVAEVDQMSGGRVELGLGAGWFEPSTRRTASRSRHGERFDRFEEQLAIITGLWATPTGERSAFDGEHYQVADSPALPKPVQAAAAGASSAAWASGARRSWRRGTPTSSTCRSSTEDGPRPVRPGPRGLRGRRPRPGDAALVQRARRSASAPTRPSWSAGPRRSAGRRRAPRERPRPAHPHEVGRQDRAVRRARRQRLYLQVLDLADLDHLRLVAEEVDAARVSRWPIA